MRDGQSFSHLSRFEGSDGTVLTKFGVEAEEEIQARQHFFDICAEWMLGIPADEGRSQGFQLPDVSG